MGRASSRLSHADASTVKDRLPAYLWTAEIKTRRDWIVSASKSSASWATSSSWGRYHEAVLANGSVPVKYLHELVRARLGPSPAAGGKG